MLSGLLSHIGLRDAEGREYLGARNAKFMIFPGSGLAKKPPRMVMVGELVETSRLWGRTAAKIQPEWGRVRRRPPHQPGLQRAPLVDPTRRRDGPREACCCSASP
ncbi:oligonucleotide/oligosaccharide-binding fold domain-containing protein [Aeromicrobium sp. UC242_57]|uniref:oligonucleotide/oligosaccharide-binding fold domain-containing protein n=1 Tax=Aeromicrobium sp. UC242_57 TaxID=3374624 RepID=UPI0037BAE6D6